MPGGRLCRVRLFCFASGCGSPDPAKLADVAPNMIAEVGLVSFFFQAEDGIRDLIVTGVQTCALPISHQVLCVREAFRVRDPLPLRVTGWVAAQGEDVADARVGVLTDHPSQLRDRVVEDRKSVV